MSEATSLPEKRKRRTDKHLEPENLKSKDLESRESCWNIMNFFKLLEEMDSNKISEKSGRNTCKGPVGSKIEYSYHIKINDPAKKEEMLRKPLF